MNKEKQLTLEILKNTYCRLKPSKISGVGVFAIRDISPNTELFKGQINQKWLKFRMKEFESLDKEIIKMIDDFFVIEKDKSVSLPRSGLNGMDMSFYVNHSKNPNAKTIDNGFTFVSLRKIKKGEEITISYASYDYKY
ncbi:SET domain-containing protein [Patescibacteria group bacterium]|nr:SET domain-containing protein [Patescibacteria group bacterium]